jgi:DNA polymerase I-like protein with 3'-5' exonuclease and polymerase domains
LGRWRTFALGDIPATEVYNFPIQCGGATIMNIQGTAFYKNVMHKVDPSALYILQGHDANYYEVSDKRADDFAHELGVAMSWKGSLYKGGPEIPFTATGHVASNLKDA